MTASQQEGFAQYGADELLAVAELLGASAFPGVDERAVGTSDEARDASLRSARRSLLARGVLEIDDDGVLRITPPHALLFRVALAPAAVVSAEYRRRGRIEGCSYYLLPDVSVEHSAAIGNVHRLDSMETTAVLGRVVEFVDLRDRPSHNGTAFEVPAAALARALESAPERDPDLSPGVRPGARVARLDVVRPIAPPQRRCGRRGRAALDRYRRLGALARRAERGRCRTRRRSPNDVRGAARRAALVSAGRRASAGRDLNQLDPPALNEIPTARRERRGAAPRQPDA